MLLNKKTLDGITEGRVSQAFRVWKRPTVKTGGTLNTRIGVLAIDSVDPISKSKITTTEAKKAGFESRAELLQELEKREGTLYRIRFHYAGEDPRIALRKKSKLTQAEVDELKTVLDRKDTRSKKPWTRTTLTLIAKHPGTRAPDLAEQCGMETKPFKANVRKLKALGLTESLAVGYRLSPRGKALLKHL